MFEDSTFESAHRIRTRSRGWSLAAFAFNSAILAALIAIPLIYPEALPKQMMNLLLVTPPPPPAAPKPIPQQPRAEAFHGRSEFVDLRLTAPRLIPTTPNTDIAERAPGNGEVIGLDQGTGIPGGDPFAHSSSKPPVVVRDEPRGPIVISKGVAEGMVIQKIIPRYPPIALASRTQGTVVLQAVISKSGTIQNLRVLSGSPMLQQAALDAVSQWRYRPYLLNGQPIDVETTINVTFSLNQ
jgi:periplasmic protein TonB